MYSSAASVTVLLLLQALLYEYVRQIISHFLPLDLCQEIGAHDYGVHAAFMAWFHMEIMIVTNDGIARPVHRICSIRLAYFVAVLIKISMILCGHCSRNVHVKSNY